VDLPHDFLISGNFSPNADEGEAFLPYNVSYYRKRLAFDPSWQGSFIEVEVEGALSFSTWWFNGQYLGFRTSGYTSAVWRLDNVTGTTYGNTTVNELVVFVDGTQKTGWWYEGECAGAGAGAGGGGGGLVLATVWQRIHTRARFAGGGLNRHARIRVTPQQARIPTFGVSAPSFVEGAIHTRATPSQGVWADQVGLYATVEVNNAAATSTTGVSVAFAVYAADGATVVGNATVGVGAVNASQTRSVEALININNAELWSVPRPYLHTLVTTVTVGGEVYDAVNSTIGFRSVTWDPQTGLYINNQAVKMRGFCDHESFAGVGSAQADRVFLLKLQWRRGMGGNAWRTSHNAPGVALNDLSDALGQIILLENRVFATQENCPGAW